VNYHPAPAIGSRYKHARMQPYSAKSTLTADVRSGQPPSRPPPRGRSRCRSLIVILIGGSWGASACDDPKPPATATQAAASASAAPAAPLVLPPMPTARETVLLGGDGVSDP